MPHIFISYCREDSRFAQVLHVQLQEAGLPTWRDPDLRPGDRWGDEIDEAMQGASALLVIMSPAAKASPYVNYEWAFARGAGVLVIPLLLGLRPEELPPRLAERKALDFSNPLARPWNELFSVLKDASLLRRPGAPRRPPPAPSVIDEAARALDSLIAEERIHAVETLAQIDDPAALEALAQAVRHPVLAVRCQAGFALAGRKDPRSVQAVLEALRNEESGDHYKYRKILAEIGPPAVPELIRALTSAHEVERRYGAVVLGDIRDSAAIPALVETLGADPDAIVRAWTVGALGEFGSLAPGAEILARLEDASKDVRSAAVRALGRMSGPERLNGLLTALKDQDPDVRAAAAEELGKTGDHAAVAALGERLIGDPSERVRKSAVEALGKIPDPAAVPVLLQATQDEDFCVPGWAIRALENIGGPEVARGLLEILRKPDSRVRSAAAQSLRAIGDRAVVPGLLTALRHEDEEIRAAAAEALGMKGNVAAVPALTEALNDPEEEVRRNAVSALGGIGDTSAAAALIQALHDSDEIVRRWAISALERLDTQEARAAVKAFKRRQ